MARFHGHIGFVKTMEVEDGVHREVTEVRPYYGDIVQNSRRLVDAEGLNDDVVLSNSFSVVADAYAFQNFLAIRFVEWMGVNWKVTNVRVQHPRLLLTVGSVYNV